MLRLYFGLKRLSSTSRNPVNNGRKKIMSSEAFKYYSRYSVNLYSKGSEISSRQAIDVIYREFFQVYSKK